MGTPLSGQGHPLDKDTPCPFLLWSILLHREIFKLSKAPNVCTPIWEAVYEAMPPRLDRRQLSALSEQGKAWQGPGKSSRNPSNNCPAASSEGGLGLQQETDGE